MLKLYVTFTILLIFSNMREGTVPRGTIGRIWAKMSAEERWYIVLNVTNSKRAKSLYTASRMANRSCDVMVKDMLKIYI